MDTSEVTPFAVSFAEPKREYPVASRTYSEADQMSSLSDGVLQNPANMSPTVYHTSGGDQIGDESY